MSLLMLSIEYMLFHTLFETLRASDEESKEYLETNTLLSKWKPLSNDELQNIKAMIQ
ncbi:MAG: hypothetical protein PHP08_00240 [Candidatus Dojkabacteria bacterium]|nr:hypothetical protein [Candidatus Dojkabacteria bacterium]